MSESSGDVGALTATGRVPAEHRVFGLDRRSLLPGLVVIGIFAFWTILIPAVNGLLDYDDTTRPGDVFAIAQGITMDAEPGWGVESGLRTSDDTAANFPGQDVALTSGGVTLQVASGPFQGDLRTLLSQIEKISAASNGDEAFHVAGDVKPFQTNQGRRGLAQGYTTVTGEGVVAALALGDTGVKVIATGPEESLTSRADAVEKMIDSISFDPDAAR